MEHMATSFLARADTCISDQISLAPSFDSYNNNNKKLIIWQTTVFMALATCNTPAGTYKVMSLLADMLLICVSSCNEFEAWEEYDMELYLLPRGRKMGKAKPVARGTVYLFYCGCRWGLPSWKM